MADTPLPLFPSKGDVGTLSQYLDIQKSLSEVLLRQSKIRESIGHEDISLESRMIKRLAHEKRLLKFNEKELELLKQAQRQSAISSGAAKEKADRDIKSISKLIHKSNKKIEQLKQLSSIEVERAKKEYTESNKWGTLMKKIGAEQFSLKVKEYEITKSIGEELQKYPFGLQKSAFFIGAIIMMLKGAYDLFNKIDESAFKFRISMGMIRRDAVNIRKEAQRLAIDFMHVGVTVDGVHDAFIALGREMGSVHIISSELVKTTALMKAQLGVAEDVTAGFLRNMAAISGTSLKSQEHMAYMAQYMSSTAGVPLNEVMKDVSTMSVKTLNVMSKYPNTILRTAIEAKRLNTSLSNMASSSAHILDFQNSIQEEMEASVLVGRGINLQRARELAFAGRIEESNREILDIARKLGFESLNYFQKDAVAKALGKGTDELLRMLQADKEWEIAKNSQDPILRKQVRAIEEMRKATDATLKSESTRVKQSIQAISNQTRLASISQKWNQIMAKAQEILLPVVDTLLAMVIPVMDIARGMFAWSGAITYIAPKIIAITAGISNLGKSIREIGVAFQTWSLAIGKPFNVLWKSGTQLRFIGLRISKLQSVIVGLFPIFTKIISKISNLFMWPIKFLDKIGKRFSMFGQYITTLGKFGLLVGKIAGFFGRWINPIGWVITAFQFVFNLFNRFKETEFVNGDWIGNIWKGIKAVGNALYDTLIQPFVDAWNWLKGVWLGRSPSLIGMGIFKGISSIGGMLYESLIKPFVDTWNWIKGNFVGSVTSSIFDGFKSIGPKLYDVFVNPFKRGHESLIKPFVDTWNWIKGNFVGSVTSSIFDGFKSIGPKLYDVFVNPFKRGLDWVNEHVPLAGKFIEKLTKEKKELVKSSVEKRVAAAYVPVVKITPEETKITVPEKKPAKKQEEKEVNVYSLDDVYNILKELNYNLTSGKVRAGDVYLDGSMVSTYLARNIELRGGFGTNK